MNAIQVEHLCKRYRSRLSGKGFRSAVAGILRPTYREVDAVLDLSFSVKQGERIAFIGPNGAGKSTTIKMLTGVLYPSSGSATVAGFTPWKDRTALSYELGTVFGQRSRLWYHLPARDSFNLFRHVYDLNRSDFLERLRELTELFDIEELLDRPVRELSLGQRMRCEIAASLLHRPSVLLLDEPSIGLDVVAKASLRDLIRAMSEKDGITILLTSHDTGDIEDVCDRAIVINHGRLLLDKPVRQLSHTFMRKKRIEIAISEGCLPELPLGVQLLSDDKHKAVLEVDTEKSSIGPLLASFVQQCVVRDITIQDTPLETVISTLFTEGVAQGRGKGDGVEASGQVAVVEAQT